MTQIRVHYPAGSHAMTLRGSGGLLSWTQGVATSRSGDTFSYAVSGLDASIEWKPLLDDATWARGPNYHASPGQAVEVWPHFASTQGQVQTLIPAFHSSALNNTRAIYAYLSSIPHAETGTPGP